MSGTLVKRSIRVQVRMTFKRGIQIHDQCCGRTGTGFRLHRRGRNGIWVKARAGVSVWIAWDKIRVSIEVTQVPRWSLRVLPCAGQDCTCLWARDPGRV